MGSNETSGIMEQDKKTEQNFNDYSDLHKEVYGYRPESDVARGFRKLSYEGQDAVHASLHAMAEEAARGKKSGDEFDRWTRGHRAALSRARRGTL